MDTDVSSLLRFPMSLLRSNDFSTILLPMALVYVLALSPHVLIWPLVPLHTTNLVEVLSFLLYDVSRIGLISLEHRHMEYIMNL